MYNSDKPIKKQSEDDLGRRAFARQLGQSILSLDTVDNFVISLNGEWGCGKTSIINMALEEIIALKESVDSTEEPIIIQFNPWNFSDTDQLINQFFKTLSVKLGHKDNTEALHNIGSLIETYSSAIEFASAIPFVGTFAKIVEAIGKYMKETAEKKVDDIIRIKTQIEQALLEQNQKIIIIIDDIDRLPNEQIRLIFQLVNSVAGFPNVRYLLSFDKEIACRALGVVQNCNGNEYLEKIIQIPFEIPPINGNKLEIVFRNKIDDFFKAHELELLEIDERWRDLYSGCISNYIEHIRNINRLFNAYQLKYSLVGRETNPLDLLSLTAIELFDSNTYKWIFDHKRSLTGEPIKRYEGNEQDQQKLSYTQSLNEYRVKNVSTSERVIGGLFPKFKRVYDDFYSSSNQYNSENARRNLRISDDFRFDLYFSLTSEDLPFSTETIETICFEESIEAVQEFLEKIDESNLDLVFIEIKSRVEKIEIERLKEILSTLLSSIIITSSSYFSCIYNMYIRLLPEDNYQIINEYIHNSIDDKLYVIGRIIERVERSYNRFKYASEYDDFQIITETHLEKVEIEFINRLKEVKNIFDCENGFDLYVLWFHINRTELENYIDDLFKDDMNKIKYLRFIAGNWHGGGTNYGYWFKEDKKEEMIISYEEIYTAINKYKNSPKILELSYDDQVHAATFSLWWETKDKKITIKKAEKEIEQWGDL